MKLQLKQLDKILLYALYGAVAGVVLTQVMGLDKITSIFFLLTFPLTVVLWLRTIMDGITKLDVFVVAIAIMACFNVLLNWVIFGGEFGFGYLKKLIMFIMTLLFFQVANRHTLRKEVIKVAYGLIDLLTVVMFLAYVLFTDAMHSIDGYLSPNLYLNFSNPNLTGLFLACMYMLVLCRFFDAKSWKEQVFCGGIAVLQLWLLMETRARNSQLVVLLVTAASIWLFFSKRSSFRMPKWVAACISVFPLVFFLGYMTVVYSRLFNWMFSFMTGIEKSLTSRVRVWLPAMEGLLESPIIGAYSQTTGGTGSGQMHNTLLELAASYGLPLMLLMVGLFTIYLYQNGRTYTKKSRFIGIITFAGALTLGIGEGAMVSGSLGLHILMGTFLMLARRPEKAEGLPNKPRTGE